VRRPARHREVLNFFKLRAGREGDKDDDETLREVASTLRDDLIFNEFIETCRPISAVTEAHICWLAAFVRWGLDGEQAKEKEKVRELCLAVLDQRDHPQFMTAMEAIRDSL
jgi:hypothetical protein